MPEQPSLFDVVSTSPPAEPVGAARAGRAVAGPAGARPHRRRPRHDAVRRGRRRRRQDDGPRRSHPRRSSTSGRPDRRRSPPSRSPRRPPASCATGSASGWRRRRRRRPPQAALDGLDHAPIGTLHAFARRLLFEFPVEAGLPPGFTVLDELESQLAFDERWEDLLDSVLDDAEREVAPDLRAAELVQLLGWRRFGVTRGLRQVTDRLPGQLGPRRAARRPRRRRRARRSRPTALVARARAIAATPTPIDDRQGERVALVGSLADRGRRRRPTSAAGWPRWTSSARIARRLGAVGQQDQLEGPAATTLDALRAEQRRAGRRGRRPPARTGSSTARRVVGAICGRFVLDGAAARAAAGTLEFHDLLVLARRLLATDAGARRAPPRALPAGAARRVPGHRPDPARDRRAADRRPGRAADRRHRRRCVPLPGRLFVVGDPKQSIYRFRRADIATYLGPPAPGRRRPRAVLSANFRSTDGGHRLGQRRVRRRHPAAGRRAAGVRAARRRPPGAAATTARCTCSAPPSTTTTTSTPRSCARREAASVAAAVATALREGWPVGDGDGGAAAVPRRRHRHPAAGPHVAADAGAGARRAGRAVPGRERVRRLPGARDPRPDAGAAGGRRPHRRAGPRRRPALAAVRLQRRRAARVARGRRPLPSLLADGARRRWPTTPSPRRSPTSRPIARDVGRVDAGRPARPHRRRAPGAGDAPSAAPTPATCGGGSATSSTRPGRGPTPAAGACGATCAGPRYQAQEGRASDTILPERDHDAVRIMTVHAAKGLEFPITIVSGMTTEVQRRSGDVGRVAAGHVGAGREGQRAVRGVQAARRADGRRRAAAPAVRGVHPGRRPPRRVAAPQAARRRPAASAKACRAPTVLGRVRRHRARRRARSTSRGAAVVRVPAEPLELPWPDLRGVGRRAGPGDGRRTRCGRRRAPPGWRSSWRRPATTKRSRRPAPRRPEAGRALGRRHHRSRAGQGRRRPRPAAVAARPLRHGDRAGRARRAAGRRPRHGRRHRRAGRRPVRGRGHLRARAAGRRPVPLGARRADRRRRRRRRRALARAVRRRRARRARCSRATSTCSCARRTGLVIVDYKTDQWRPAPTRTAASPATAASSRPTASPSGACSTSRSPAASSCAAAPTARPSEIPLADWPQALADVAALGTHGRRLSDGRASLSRLAVGVLEVAVDVRA